VGKVFISYDRRDSIIAERLRDELRQQAIEVWLDTANVAPGASIPETIQKAISDATYVIVLVTTHSLASSWVQLETRFALNSAQARGRSDMVIPIRHDARCALPSTLEERLCVDLSGNWQEALATLLKVLRKDTIPDASNRQLVVDVSGLSPFRSINEALDCAEAGDQIVIREGVYREALFITKAVELIGDPLDPAQRATVSYHEPNFVQMHSTHVSLRNLCFAFEAREEAVSEAVDAELRQPADRGLSVGALLRAAEARLWFREQPPYAAGPVQIPVLECVKEAIRAPRGPILYSHMSSGTAPDTGRIVEPTKSDINYADSLVGVYVNAVILFAVEHDLQRHDAAGELLIEDCDIDGADACDGVVTSGNVILRSTTIRRPRDAAAVLRGKGSLLVEDCSFNAESKRLECNGTGRALIRNCRFTSASLVVEFYAHARVISSIFEDSQVHVSSHARVEMKRCKLRKKGILLNADAYLRLEESSVSESETWAVYISTGSFAHLSRCTIFNSQYGIYVSENCQGNVIEECNVHGNTSHGVVLRKKSRSILVSSNIYSNGGHGVCCELNAFGEIRECKLYDNRRSGAAVFSGGELDIFDTDICRNENYGVQTESKARALVAGCNVLQNGDDQFDRTGSVRVIGSPKRP
jgi:parallel beta-helix repeat protein